MSHPRVLLAKHDSHFLNSLSRVLSRQSDLPFDIAIASESTEALSGPGGPYAALVCLVETPEQIPLLRRLKQQHGGLPLLALVPAAETTLAEEARRAGAEVILQNPNPESTATLLQSALTLLINSRRTML